MTFNISRMSISDSFHTNDYLRAQYLIQHGHTASTDIDGWSFNRSERLNKDLKNYTLMRLENYGKTIKRTETEAL